MMVGTGAQASPRDTSEMQIPGLLPDVPTRTLGGVGPSELWVDKLSRGFCCPANFENYWVKEGCSAARTSANGVIKKSQAGKGGGIVAEA